MDEFNHMKSMRLDEIAWINLPGIEGRWGALPAADHKLRFEIIDLLEGATFTESIGLNRCRMESSIGRNRMDKTMD